MVKVNAETVLAAAIINAILFDPASIKILLLQSTWVFIPAIRQASSLDFLILFLCILSLGNRNKSRIDDLTVTGLEALGAEAYLKDLEELLDHTLLTQLLSEIQALQPQAQGYAYAELKKLLENQHLESDHSRRHKSLRNCHQNNVKVSMAFNGQRLMND